MPEASAEVNPLTLQRLKELIVSRLHLEGISPDDIGDDEQLFGDGLGLDSVDALELVVALEKEFGLKIRSQEIEPEAFATSAKLFAFIQERIAAERDGSA